MSEAHGFRPWMQSNLIDPAMFAGLQAALTPLQVLPLHMAMRTAKQFGYHFGRSKPNRKRVERAVDRLRVAMPELDDVERYELVIRSYEHLAMLSVEFVRTARFLTDDSWADYIELGDLRSAVRPLLEERPTLLLTGHCGNWEILGYTLALLGFRLHALYRPLDFKPFDRWARNTRSRRGLELVDKFGAMKRMPELLDQNESVAIVADQNAGARGLQVPFFGRLASSYKAIGLMAIQHNARILVGHATRVFPAHDSPGGVRYKLEVVDCIYPEHWKDQPDPLFYISARYRRGIEQMIRSAPDQTLWMHRFWKSRPRHERLDKPFPEALKRKLLDLPWMDDAQVEAIVEQSDRDRAMMLSEGITEFR